MKKFLLFFFFLGTWSALSAQTEISTLPRWRSYATQSRMSALQNEHPEMFEAMKSIEQFTSDFRSKGRYDSVTIPVVVHILPLPGGITVSDRKSVV